MPRIAKDVKKHTFHLRSGDYDALAMLFPNTPTAQIIRNLVSDFVDRAKLKKGMTSDTARVVLPSDGVPAPIGDLPNRVVRD